MRGINNSILLSSGSRYGAWVRDSNTIHFFEPKKTSTEVEVFNETEKLSGKLHHAAHTTHAAHIVATHAASGWFVFW